MFGTLVVAKNASLIIPTVPEVVATVNTRYVLDDSVPQDLVLPALLFYSEAGTYDGRPIRSGVRIPGETVRFVTRFIDDGESFVPIVDAAEKLLEAFDGQSFEVEYRSKTYLLTYQATGEHPLPTITLGDQHYRQLGTIYQVRVT